VAREQNKARIFLEKVTKLRAEHNDRNEGDWIFGSEIGPTALDAHTVVFIARLIDAGRADLVGGEMLDSGTSKMKSEAWTSVVKGRPTLHSLWERQAQNVKI
jgi:hypothetical protein